MEQHLLDIPRTKMASFGDRSFSVVGPRLWNALPIDAVVRNFVGIQKRTKNAHFQNILLLTF